jgi:NAD(P)-dependent dehydrogenase (short-subunit alcohol dehydrogenase family)
MIADIADGTEVANAIAATSGANSVASVKFDVSDEAQVKKLVAQTIERFGQIDVLVNNAALYAKLQPTKATEIDTALWDQVMAVNVRGAFLMVKHVVPHMQAKKSGKIINIASGTAYKGIPHMLHYVTSKGAIVTFTRALSRELGADGIAVNTLAPGLVLSDTGIENTAHHDEMRAPVRNSRAFKRDMFPEDLLGALVFLASDDSNFITGQTIAVDGGSINT